MSLAVNPAYDNRAKQYDAYWPDRWRCFSCGMQDFGDTAEAFLRLAREAGLAEGKPRKPHPERLPRLWWERAVPPWGSRPDFSLSWLGAPIMIEEEHDAQGRVYGYRVSVKAVRDALSSPSFVTRE
jgi:hypothetical protein